MPGENPILNNPYEEPLLHYATNLAGELDYSVVKDGRRPFSPDVQLPSIISAPQKGELGKIANVAKPDDALRAKSFRGGG